MSACPDCGRALGFDVLQCSRCGAWADGGSALGTVSKAKTTTLDQVDAVPIERIQTGHVWDRAWGGGFVPSSISLLGGPPGAGKSSMLLQIASSIAAITGRVFYYMSAEQSPGEIKLMANRLRLPNMNRIRVLSEMGGGAEIDEALFKDDPPAGMAVDSISALCGPDKHAALSIAKRYKLYSSKHKAPSFLIAHMTKEGDMAGLLALQHEVDALVTVGQEPSNRKTAALLMHYPDELLEDVRVLRAWKNRYGPTAQDHLLAMTPHGLVGLPPPPPPEPQKPRRRRPPLESADVVDVDGQRLVRRKPRPQP